LQELLEQIKPYFLFDSGASEESGPSHTISWNAVSNFLFYKICVEEIKSGAMQKGTLTNNACLLISKILSKPGLTCNERQVRQKWDALKRKFRFYDHQVVNAEDDFKDEKNWQITLKVILWDHFNIIPITTRSSLWCQDSFQRDVIDESFCHLFLLLLDHDD
jgi:hypothetical protein